MPSEGQDRPSSPPETSPATEVAPKQPEYINRLTGRIGGTPRFHETRAGTLVGEFDLAVRDPDNPETTIWHRIAFFGERAAALRENGLRKGEVVDLIGAYRHVSEYTRNDGTVRRKEELRPTLVKRR
jgi:single-stranded DNA-binding protein